MENDGILKNANHFIPVFGGAVYGENASCIGVKYCNYVKLSLFLTAGCMHDQKNHRFLTNVNKYCI
jgi:hypothetical protein